jgi:hypothetical protein
MFEMFMLVIAILVFALPLISVGLYGLDKSYNVVRWEEYYGRQGENFQFYVDGDFDNTSLYDSNRQTFHDNQEFTQYKMELDNKEKIISDGKYTYQFIMNGSSDITYCSQYNFTEKKIFDYYPVQIGNLPIKLLYHNIIKSITEVKTKTWIIPYNWTQVWDNIDIYFYYADENGDGIAFNYGKNETIDSESSEVSLTTDFGVLNLDTYYVNISGYKRYDGLFPKFFYETKPIDADDIFIDDFSSKLKNSTSIVTDIFDSIVDNYGLDTTALLNYDELIIDISQYRGFPERSSIPYVKAVKCGWYIHVNKDFNLKSDMGASDQIYIFDQLYSNNPSTGDKMEFLNGFSFNDYELYIGEMISVSQSINDIIFYDVLIIFSVIGLLSIIAIVVKYPSKYIDHTKLKINDCLDL